MHKNIFVAVLLAIVAVGLYSSKILNKERDAATPIRDETVGLSVAYFAGGCFWSVESALEKLGGVTEIISGYMGGEEENVSYEDVASGKTRHRETVQVFYDPAKVSYEELTEYFLKHIDPTDEGGSFYDRGYQYTSAIFYLNETEKDIAISSISKLDQTKVLLKPIVTKVELAKKFFPAEEYHQDYSKKNPTRYALYRKASGRDSFFKETWEKFPENTVNVAPQSDIMVKVGSWKTFVKPSDGELKKILTPLQYSVTQKEGTETPYDNVYVDNKREGIYVDIVSGEPLFSSKDKYDSETGWPSFTKPLVEGNIVEKKDSLLGFSRTEIRSKYGNSHLGHVFDDGPRDRGGKRYCMNSAAMKFILKADMDKLGYREYLKFIE